MPNLGTQTLDAVSASLVGASIGQVTDNASDWYIYQGAAPDSGPAPPATFADRIIVLYETPGKAPLEAWAIVYPHVQIAIRGAPDDYQAVRNKIEDVFNQIQSNEMPLGSAFVYAYALHSSPINLGMDEKRRIRLAMNFRFMRNTPA